MSGSNVFPLLDLDDDAIKVALGFSDPRSLSSTTMTCRRLRHLSDAAWKELDKHIDQNRREGGDTPRERVLSSFVIHNGRNWGKYGRFWLFGAMDAVVRARSCDDTGMQCISSQDLSRENHLCYLQLRNQVGDGYTHSFSGMTPKQSELNATTKFIYIPLKKKLLEWVRKSDPSLRQYDLNLLIRNIGDAEGGLNSSKIEKIQYAFRHIDVTINRRTLEPKILFKKETDYPVPQSSLGSSFRFARLPSGSYRVEFRKNWTMKLRNTDDSKTREVGFYFENDGFGLTIGPALMP